ncbi:14906_t:CDS:2 [Entrophospora sp. SA101]|nr:2061_t:CDS:2 [Entrophospora sp. SA101]CAJ0745318.1 14906_t:CDS:2 [Entrophospora sp. SA101]
MTAILKEMDLRILVDGAGQHNWGKTVDDEFDDEHDIYEEGC